MTNGNSTAAERLASGSRTEISPQEFAAALEVVRAGNIRISTVSELLRAFELGVLTKTEARRQLGLGATQGNTAADQTRAGGRFVRDDSQS
jgi:hypothetical protein